MIALFWLGVLCICLAAAAFVSDLAITLWEGWDAKRRLNRLEDVDALKRVLGLET